MERPGFEQVLHAIKTLYEGQDLAQKDEASKWLEHLQNSVFAWEVADHLLTSKPDSTSCYFAAQTMRTKIQFYFHELQPAQYESLKESLLNHITHLHGSTQAITNQLCLAIADLAVQMPQWGNPVKDLIDRFSKSIKMIPDLVEMLQFLTEEIKSEHLHIGANRREEVANLLRQSSLTVIQLLNACIEQCPNENSIRRKIFDCFGGWLLLGAFPPNEVMKSRLLPVLFETLADEKGDDDLQEASADCICNAIYAAMELGPQNQLSTVLFSEVLKFLPIYEQARNDDSYYRCLNLCRVFTELAEATLASSISSKQQNSFDLRSVELIVKCVQHNEYEVAEITFNYWYNLSEAIYREELKMRRESFQPYYHALFEQLVNLCKLDYDSKDAPDFKSDFGEFRSRVVDLIKDSAFMIGSDNLFSQLCQTLLHDMDKVVWVDIEARLFIMSAVSANITIEKSDDVVKLLDMLFNKPNNNTHVAVKFTAMALLGELAAWIEKNSEVLDIVLQILYQGLQTKAISSAAAGALQLVCCSCQKKMAHHFSVLLQVVQAIDSLSISPVAILDFFQGVAHVLSELPKEQIAEGMKQICAQQVHLLAQLLGGRNGGHSDPVVYLDRIATIFRYTMVKANIGETHPCFEISQEVWPVLSMSFTKYAQEARVMERCCRCVRFIIRCLGLHFCPLLGQLASQMVQVYSTAPHSCFLYLGSILVDEFGQEKSCIPGLVQMAESLCHSTFGFLNNEQAFINHPDTVDDLFRLCTRCVQTCPIDFLKCSVADSVVKCAVAGSTLGHREANASVMTFLRDLLHGPSDQLPGTDPATLRNLISQVMSKHGQDITTGLVQACAGKIPSYMVPNVGDVFWELLKFDKQVASDWLAKSIKALPTKTISGTNIVTEHQLMEFHHAIVNSEAAKIASRSARTFARLYE